MPELPEVHTTTTGLHKKIVGLKITDVWSDWKNLFKGISFKNFQETVVNRKIISTERRGKNILINLAGGKTILIHMKMTGHLMYGQWRQGKGKNEWAWTPTRRGALNDPYNRFIHVLFRLSNECQLAFSDARKFGKITAGEKIELEKSEHLNLGPDPLNKNLSFKNFKTAIQQATNAPIKTTLTNQKIISGIGNIYSDEILWSAGIHPQTKISKIPDEKLRAIFLAAKTILKKSISLGGDSTSDYRNIDGEKGNFQNHHMAYRQKGKKCLKPRCRGTIERVVIKGRSAHFCGKHQKLKI